MGEALQAIFEFTGQPHLANARRWVAEIQLTPNDTSPKAYLPDKGSLAGDARQMTANDERVVERLKLPFNWR